LSPPPDSPGAARPGQIYLVGAGPGDPGLITVRGRELLKTADVIFYDRLIPSSALADARPDAELVYVGKRPGVVTMPQEEIIERMIRSARGGRSVVRLKGGDPYLFGRGAEEAEAAVDAGIAYEVVPGVTAGIAATAYAGIPVTHREEASAVAFVTGHEDPRKPDTAIDWTALAAFPGTLVFYMGVRRLQQNAAALIAGGRRPEEPAAAIEQGTTSRQRVVTGRLSIIADLVAETAIKAPALIVVGEVAAHRDKLEWFERRPLHGRTVVVTRARDQAGALASRLRSLGAEVVEMPLIRIEPLADQAATGEALMRLAEGGYELLCVTSPNGASMLFGALRSAGLDARALAGVRIAAMGPGTAEALSEGGISADTVASRPVAEGLLAELDDTELSGSRVLVVQAEGARPVLREGLAGRGAQVEVLALYRTVSKAPDQVAAQAAGRAGWITFTSASTVASYVEAFPQGPPAQTRVISIGPVTSSALRSAGVTVAREAAAHDLDGLIAALTADAGPGGDGAEDVA
jgi:uroporphyrinogen III methyltransferase/synthase